MRRKNDGTRRISQRQRELFQKKIFTWWENHRRDLPWRRTHDPYRILVSEVMLQQTQVARVLPKYQEFLTQFPTVFSLAQASLAAVLKAWKGMGYNRRALYLQQAARGIVQTYKGVFPKRERELMSLPGLGTYTARALLVFAFKQNTSMIDTNIRQIITHFFFEGVTQKESVIQDVAHQLLPHGKSWEWHQALMDYGALEMSKIGSKEKREKKRKIPFRESRRFFRGRVVDKLREGDMMEDVLINELSKSYDKPQEFLYSIVKDLEKDGLIYRASNGIMSLPK